MWSMFRRLLELPNQSFFLFGPRGSGKSTWLHDQLPATTTHWVDLLDLRTQRRLARRPETLSDELLALPKKLRWVAIDEVQKIPALLDSVQALMASRRFTFALTGSSARKLKRGAANLLAGRAVERRLFPLTTEEIGRKASIETVLTWGSLPGTLMLRSAEDRDDYLHSYAHLYLKEEIQEEQIVRKLDPFRVFLEVAAQADGKILNFTKLANDVGIDAKTAISFFQILEDTLLGFLLPAFRRSLRKRQRKNPKFYFFDLGVRRALDGTLGTTISPQTSEWGRSFESWVINEVMRWNEYARTRYRLSFYSADEGDEVDLILDRPGRATVLLEIKSTTSVDESCAKALKRHLEDFEDARGYVLSMDPEAKDLGGIRAVHWQDGIREIFGAPRSPTRTARVTRTRPA